MGASPLASVSSTQRKENLKANVAMTSMIMRKFQIVAQILKLKKHSSRYAIDPPEHDEKDFPNQLCTTVCPAADGMTYTTSYAETFKMDCGKRHGTTILSWGYADNFEQCMENCGALVACHSVDYQSRTRKVSSR